MIILVIKTLVVMIVQVKRKLTQYRKNNLVVFFLFLCDKIFSFERGIYMFVPLLLTVIAGLFIMLGAAFVFFY